MEVVTVSDEKQTAFPAPEFREYAMGALPVDHRDVHRHAGLVQDKTAQRMLTQAAEAYEPLKMDAPDSFWETQFATQIIRSSGTETATRALQHGHHHVLDYMSGLVGYETDASGIRAFAKFQQLIERTPVFIGYIWGLMGSGKTDFSVLTAVQIMDTVFDNTRVFTNFECDGADERVKRYSRLIEVMEERRETLKNGGDPGDEVVVVIDEAAQLFTGSGADQQKSKALAKLLKLARKSQVHILLIGQDGKDIGPSLRALCTVFVEKKSKKNVVFWSDVKNREGIHKIMSLKGVPATDINFNTYDEGSFIFDPDEEDEEDAESVRKRLEALEKEHERKMMTLLSELDNGMSQQEIAELYGYSSAKTVRRARQKYSDELSEMGVAL